MQTLDGAFLRAREGYLLKRPTITRHEQYERQLIDTPYGSHMPLDTSVHWDWRNPLNILPALVLFVVLLALVELVLA
jgi:hypothetical protein